MDLLELFSLMSIGFVFVCLVLVAVLLTVGLVNAEPEIRTFEDCLKAGIVPKLCIAMFPQVLQGANFTGGFPFP